VRLVLSYTLRPRWEKWPPESGQQVKYKLCSNGRKPA
jgi:hypothetical protein